VDICPGDIVIRTAPVREPARRRDRRGVEQGQSYTVTTVSGDMIKLSGFAEWYPAKCFEVLLHEPCA
jgi:hypothetical protein